MPGRRGLLVSRWIGCVAAIGLATGCWRAAPPPDPIAAAVESYVALAGQLSTRDPQSASGDTVNEVAPLLDGVRLPLGDMADRAKSTAASLRSMPGPVDDERRAWLEAQLDAIATRASWLNSSTMTVDEELQGLFGVSRPAARYPSLVSVRTEIGQLLPGGGTASARLERFDAQALVPVDRLPPVFSRALAECRARTAARMPLPANEQVDVRYVTGRPWSGFSRYVGPHHSTIEVNVSLPLTVDRVLDLACHEGYPGHHVLNMMRADRAAQGRPELTAVPLFTPDAFASEAAAATASADVFSDEERLAFERDVLFPLAGLDPSLAVAHAKVGRLVARLSPTIGAALIDYIAGTRDYVETAWALQEEALMEHPQATIQFANQYRGFVLAYTWSGPAPPGSTSARWSTGSSIGPSIPASN